MKKMEIKRSFDLNMRMFRSGIEDLSNFINTMFHLDGKNVKDIRMFFLNETKTHLSLKEICSYIDHSWNGKREVINQNRRKIFSVIYHNENDVDFYCINCKKFINRKYLKTRYGHFCSECTSKKMREEVLNNLEYIKSYQKGTKFVYSQLKYQANKRGYSFEIDYEYYLKNLANAKCVYCGSDNTKHWIDREKNEIGYTVENSVPCCELCNKSKMNRTKESFIEHCKKVALFNQKDKIN